MLILLGFLGGSNFGIGEKPCDNWVFGVIFLPLSSFKISQIPRGFKSLKTVWAPAHKGSNPFPSATSPDFLGAFLFLSADTGVYHSENPIFLIVYIKVLFFSTRCAIII